VARTSYFSLYTEGRGARWGRVRHFLLSSRQERVKGYEKTGRVNVVLQDIGPLTFISLRADYRDR